MTAIAAACIVGGAAIISAVGAKQAADKNRRFAKNEAERQRQYEEDQVKAVQESPMAMAAPIFGKFGLGVFEQAFAKHGITLPTGDIIKAMKLDQIIENNANGKPWDFDPKADEVKKQEIGLQMARRRALDDQLAGFNPYGGTAKEPTIPNESGQVASQYDSAVASRGDEPTYIEALQGRYATANEIPTVEETAQYEASGTGVA